MVTRACAGDKQHAAFALQIVGVGDQVYVGGRYRRRCRHHAFGDGSPHAQHLSAAACPFEPVIYTEESAHGYETGLRKRSRS